jgi:hypothetical protein
MSVGLHAGMSHIHLPGTPICQLLSACISRWPTLYGFCLR